MRIRIIEIPQSHCAQSRYAGVVVCALDHAVFGECPARTRAVIITSTRAESTRTTSSAKGIKIGDLRSGHVQTIRGFGGALSFMELSEGL